MLTQGPNNTNPEAQTGGDATCCGRSLWPAGGPLVNACQLCPNSPTYWQASRADADPPGCTCDQYEDADDCGCLTCREDAQRTAGCSRRLAQILSGQARSDRLYDGMCDDCFELARDLRMCGMRVAEHAPEAPETTGRELTR